MYQLEEPQYFYLLLLIPAVLVFYGLFLTWKRKAQNYFGDRDLLQRLSPERSKNKPLLKLILALCIIALLALALVNPQVGSRLELPTPVVLIHNYQLPLIMVPLASFLKASIPTLYPLKERPLEKRLI